MTPIVILLFLLSEAVSGEDGFSDPHVVTVSHGASVVLDCNTSGVHITAVEWTRDDLPAEYVLFHRDGHCDPAQQHVSFRGRVDLADRKLQNGNVSLFLMNTTSHDQGVYRCRVALAGPMRLKRAVIDEKPIGSIQLVVKGLQSGPPTNGGPSHGYVGLAAAVVLVVLTIAVVLGGMFKRRLNLRPERSAGVKTVDDALI